VASTARHIDVGVDGALSSLGGNGFGSLLSWATSLVLVLRYKKKKMSLCSTVVRPIATVRAVIATETCPWCQLYGDCRRPATYARRSKNTISDRSADAKNLCSVMGHIVGEKNEKKKKDREQDYR
jgi:hypothetical protein